MSFLTEKTILRKNKKEELHARLPEEKQQNKTQALDWGKLVAADKPQKLEKES